MSDRRTQRGSLGKSWREFARSLAVAAGALTALAALMFHVPVWLASLRGAIAFAAISIVARGTCAWVEWLESRPTVPVTSARKADRKRAAR